MPKKSFSRYSSLLTIFVLSLSIILTNTNLLLGETSGRGTWAVYTPKDRMIAQWKVLCDAYPQWASYESIGKSMHACTRYGLI